MSICCGMLPVVMLYDTARLKSLSIAPEVKPRQELPDVKPPTPEVCSAHRHMLHIMIIWRSKKYESKSD